jgi:hypothetical protein
VQRGQALPFALILLSAGAAALYLAFNAAQLAHAKTKEQDTADSAAYSVGVLQARDLNFAAYANRAMIANQVAAAQMVSVKSYIDELGATYGPTSWDRFFDAVATVTVEWTGPKKSGSAVIKGVRRLLDSTLPIATAAIDDLNMALSKEQALFHGSMELQIPLLADEVAQANQPDSHVTKTYFATRGAPALYSVMQFAKQNTPAGKTGSDRFADVVTNKTTLDGFVPQRGLNVRVPFEESPSKCEGWISATNTHLGGAQLRQDKRGWESLDATDVNGVLICIILDVPVPIPFAGTEGSGGAANGPGGRYSSRNGYGGYNNFGGSLTNLLTRFAAQSQYSKGAGKSMSRNGGLQPYYELSSLPTAATGSDFNRAPAITVEVQRASSSIRSTDRIKIGTGALQVQDGTAQNQMRSLSSASAYFIRPDNGSGGSAGGLLNVAHWKRGDNTWEYPSLFNPYWQSSLVKTNVAAVEAADLAQAEGAP